MYYIFFGMLLPVHWICRGFFQIEGAFAQGFGLFLLEELQYSHLGELRSKGPGIYKIPAAGDIPRELHVSLLSKSENPRAIFSSKVQKLRFSKFLLLKYQIILIFINRNKHDIIVTEAFRAALF